MKKRGKGRQETKGKFIVFEGPDGCGKTTQAFLLAKSLRGAGIETELEKEPNDPELSRILARLESRRAACLLFAADRAQHSEKIRSLLDAGTWVICDRFTDSCLAYQAGGWGMPLKEVQKVNSFSTSLTPDLTFVFSLSPSLAFKRMSRRGGASAFDRDFPLQKRVACFYRRLASEGGSRVFLDSSPSPRILEASVRKEVGRKWGLLKAG